jgi:hypothetical protein
MSSAHTPGLLFRPCDICGSKDHYDGDCHGDHRILELRKQNAAMLAALKGLFPLMSACPQIHREDCYRCDGVNAARAAIAATRVASAPYLR